MASRPLLPLSHRRLLCPSSPSCLHPARETLSPLLLSDVSSSEPPLPWPGGTDDCCLWEGVSCNADGSVVRLLLPGRGLGGNLSFALQGLGRLVELNLSHNSIGGVLPQFLLWSDHIVSLDVSFNLLHGNLPPPPPPPLPLLENSTRSYPIQSLNVSRNSFSGEFPHLPGLPHLREVDASYNGFSGPIPSPACGLSSSLRVLALSFNQFAGSFPSGWGNCSELAVLDAGFNRLSGRLPDDLFAAAQLRQLAMPYNRLAGELRGDLLSRLSNLVVLDLRGNDLEGELPRDLGRLTLLEQLLLSENRLNGTIPTELLSNCTNLQTLDLRNNNLTGDISALDFSPLSQLTTLDLGSNEFTALRFPASIYSCTSLTALRLTYSSIRGQLKPGILELRSLSYLSLTSNKLEGIGKALQILRRSENLTVLFLGGNFYGEEMPDGPVFEGGDAFPNLRVLSLTGCRLTGTIPSWISRLGKLEALDLSYNQLAGGLPSWLGSLANLFYLHFSGNRLSGEIPKEIKEIKALQVDAAQVHEDGSYLDLPLFRGPTANATGLLYNQVSCLPASLMLHNNSLRGAIPPAIGRLKRLRRLDLSLNNFSGEIPANLSDLTYLEMLNLARNRLSGPIPKSLIRLTFLSNFSVGGNNLSGPVPSERQFAAFDASSYEGNEYLCGEVLNVSCSPASYAERLASDGGNVLLVVTLMGGIAAFAVTAYLLLSNVKWVNSHGRFV